MKRKKKTSRQSARNKKRNDVRRKGALESYRELLKLFGDDCDDMLRLAASGSSPDDIAKKLGVSTAHAKNFIERFVSLPSGYDKLLLRVPSVLSNKSRLKSAVRAAMKARRGRH